MVGASNTVKTRGRRRSLHWTIGTEKSELAVEIDRALPCQTHRLRAVAGIKGKFNLPLAILALKILGDLQPKKQVRRYWLPEWTTLVYLSDVILVI